MCAEPGLEFVNSCLFFADRKTFSVIHFAGYLKSWPPTKMGLQEDNEDNGDSCNLSCLVAVGKFVPPFSPQSVPDSSNIQVRQTEFVSRHTTDGKFTYVDQRYERKCIKMYNLY